MIRTLLHVLAAAAWFVAVFFLGFHLFFPSDAALERIRWEVDERSGGGWALQASSASPWRVTGLSMSDVEILSVEKKRSSRRSRTRTDDEPPPDEPQAKKVLAMERLGARLRLSSILHAAPDVGFAADLYGGEFGGHVRVGEDRTVLAFDVEDVDLSRIPIAGKTWSLEATGEIRARADLDLDAKDVKNSAGSFGLFLDDLVLRRGSIAGFALPEDITFTKAILELDVKEGKGTVTEGTFASSLFDATVDGDVTLNKRFTRSRLRLEVTLTLQESLDTLVRLLPAARDARDDEGVYHFVVSGTLASPYVRGNLNRRRPSPRSLEGKPGLPGGDRGPGVIMDPGPGTGVDETRDDSPEKRRLREERLRERRERLKQRRDIARGGADVPEDGGEGPRNRRRPERYEDEQFYDPEDLPPEDLPPEEEEDLPWEEERPLDDVQEPPPFPEDLPPQDENDEMLPPGE